MSDQHFEVRDPHDIKLRLRIVEAFPGPTPRRSVEVLDEDDDVLGVLDMAVASVTWQWKARDIAMLTLELATDTATIKTLVL